MHPTRLPRDPRGRTRRTMSSCTLSRFTSSSSSCTCPPSHDICSPLPPPAPAASASGLPRRPLPRNSLLAYEARLRTPPSVDTAVMLARRLNLGRPSPGSRAAIGSTAKSANSAQFSAPAGRSPRARASHTHPPTHTHTEDWRGGMDGAVSIGSGIRQVKFADSRRTRGVSARRSCSLLVRGESVS